MQPVHDAASELIGTVVDGRYRVESLIGQGGQATVYLARHEKLGSRHAMKVVAARPDARARILQEGQVQAALVHPNVVRVTDVVELGRALGLIMEYVEGPDLARVIQHRRLTLDQVDGVARAMLSAMVAAHDLGLVHRDLKPENVLMYEGPTGVVPKVSDFGLALRLDAPTRQTPTGAVMGTPFYMSPEQIKNGRSVDHRSDLWAIGAILYELLSGRVAFDGDDLLEIFTKVDRASPPPLDGDLPPRMVRTIDRALSRDPEERFLDARAMLAAWEGDEHVVPSEEVRIVGLDLGAVARDGGATSPQTWRPSTVRTSVAMGIGLVGILVAGLGTVVAVAAVLVLVVGVGRSTSDPPAEAASLRVSSALPAVPEPEEALEAFVDDEGELEPVEDAPPEPVTVEPRVGTVIASNATVHLRREGRSYPVPGEVPIGEYEVVVAFGAQDSFVYEKVLTVQEEAVHEVRCNPAAQLCGFVIEER